MYRLCVQIPMNPSFRLIPPKPSTNVEISLMIEHISHVNERSMDYELTVLVCTYWRDHRFEKHPSSNFVPVNELRRGQLWQPSIFFLNEKMHHRHYNSKEDTVLLISPDGEMIYTERLSLRLSCMMDLSFYVWG